MFKYIPYLKKYFVKMMNAPEIPKPRIWSDNLYGMIGDTFQDEKIKKKYVRKNKYKNFYLYIRKQ